jgi:ComEC/Rec2-related protein
MKFRRTTVISLLLLCFLAGMGFSRTGRLISYEVVISLGLMFLITVRRLRRMALLSAILFGLALGWLRGQLYLPNVSLIDQVAGQKVTVEVFAIGDTYYNSRGQMTFDAGDIKIIEPYEQDVTGRMSISGFGVPVVFNGDTMEATGRLYKTRGSKQLGMSFAQISLIEKGGSWVDDLRRSFAAGLATAVPEPASSLGIGLLIGQRSTLPDAVEAQLAAVGLTHIVAVSGYNLTILMRPIKILLKRRSKYQIALASTALITIFLLMTGLSASIVRAAVVSGLSLLAWYYGREIKPVLLILLAAFITAAVNPFYIWSDIGWYLSFLAFFGVLVLAPEIQKRIYKKKEPKIIGGLMLESFCAMVMTMPLVMFIFKQVSIVALPANLLVVPLVPLAMLFSMVAGIAGMLAPLASGIFAIPATVLMTAMLDIVSLFSRVPNALAKVGMSLQGLIVMYASILFTLTAMWHKNSQNAKITEK